MGDLRWAYPASLDELRQCLYDAARPPGHALSNAASPGLRNRNTLFLSFAMLPPWANLAGHTVVDCGQLLRSCA